MLDEKRLPIYTQKEVLSKLCISQSTLYRIRKENNLLTNKVKRRYTEEEIEELGKMIIEQYN